jgi:phenylacetate-CoA ligase
MFTEIIDLLTQKNIAKYLKRYTETQWYTKEAMDNFQLEKLIKLIDHCYHHVPFYRNHMVANNIKLSDIKNLESIKLFPIITKEIIKENYEDFTPLNLKNIKGVKTSQTGGTTGNILFKRNDANTRSSIWASFYRFEKQWMNVKSNDHKLILMGGHVAKVDYFGDFKKLIFNFLNNSYSYNPYNTSSINVEKIINYLKTQKIDLIRSYSQYLYSIALELKKRKIKLNIKAITTTAEPITENHRKLFKDVFNADVFDQYGCGEIGGIAYECEKHNGLHIANERVIIEQNESNDLIITDLDNYAMPFIRYWNADQAIIVDENCKCGRNGKMIKQIMGRTCDYIIGIENQFLHWAYFWHLLFDSEIAEKRNLKKFQVVQNDRYNIILRIICDKMTNIEENNLIDNMKQRVGNMNIVIAYETEIENTKTGKYRPVINKLL